MRTSAYTEYITMVMMMLLSTNGKAGKIEIIMNKLLSPGFGILTARFRNQGNT